MQSWSHIALARRTLSRPGFDELRATLREVARIDAQRGEKAEAALVALAACRREFDADPLIGPLPQSLVALGQALEALEPIERAACSWRRRMVGQAERLAIASLGAMIYERAKEYPASRARSALMSVAHDLECDDPANGCVDVLDARLRALNEAAHELASFGLAGVLLGLRRKRARDGRRAG